MPFGKYTGNIINNIPVKKYTPLFNAMNIAVSDPVINGIIGLSKYLLRY